MPEQTEIRIPVSLCREKKDCVEERRRTWCSTWVVGPIHWGWPRFEGSELVWDRDTSRYA